MKLSIAFGVFVLLPLIASAQNEGVDYAAEFVDGYAAAAMKNVNELDVSDICANETLTLEFSTSLTLGKGFVGAPSIRCITVRTTKLDMTSGAFDNLTNLKYVDLRNNGIETRNLFAFGPLPNVKVLLLGDQSYSYSVETRINDVYPELEYLNLTNTGFSSFSSTEGNPFPKLKYLILARNKREQISLSAIPDTLTYLDLSDNSITRYTPRFGNLSFLRLDDNNIRTIGDYGLDLTELKHLEILSLTNNQISSVSRGAFCNLANLRYLNLSDNSLSSFNLMSELEYLKSLEILALDRNSFEEVPKMCASNMTILTLKCNNITQLTVNSFVNVTNLRKLNLSNNKISFLHPDAFQNQRLLEELSLDNNQIDYLPAGWSDPLKSLRYLNLSRNKFVSLESLFVSRLPPNLEVLHFEGNDLTYLKKSTLQTMSENLTIYLNTGSESRPKPCGSSLSLTAVSPSRPGKNYYYNRYGYE